MTVRIAVLGGGVSPEHDVSLRSATEVAQALVDRGFVVVPVRIDRGGLWAIAEPGADAAEVFGGVELPALGPLEAVLALERLGVDAVFPALHGRGGEDGSVQALLESSGLPYVGSRLCASAIAMSKVLTRLAFLGAGLPMARGLVPSRDLGRNATDAELLAEARDRQGLRFPWFLKADLSGSSLGVERVADAEGFAPALARLRAGAEDWSPDWILEEGVAGIEFTVCVLGNAGGPLEALPPVEIRPRTAGFFDYGAKYDPGATDELCPAPSLDEALDATCRELGRRAHDLLGCQGFSRTDLILAEDGRFRLLETNTIPGLTRESLTPKAAQAGGMDFGDLVSRLVSLALEGRREPGRVPLAP
ncbi:MAG: D-alanine--D-alanine ligase [Planctomycetota bacterium]